MHDVLKKKKTIVDIKVGIQCKSHAIGIAIVHMDFNLSRYPMDKLFGPVLSLARLARFTARCPP